MPTSVYLSGPPSLLQVNDLTTLLQSDWKAYAASTFLRSGITVANPIELDLSGFIKKVEELSSTVKHSLSLIDRADSVLANLTQLSESATMEIFYAFNQGKQVVVVGNEPFNPWVMFHSEARFQKLKEALDYLVNQPSGFDTVGWSTQFENKLKRKSEQFPPEGELDFEYYGGSLPVLVLAPHATSFFKESTYYQSESYTGTLAVLLHKLTNCHTLISSYCVAADPVFYLNSPYVNFLIQLLKKIDFKMVILLHAAQLVSPNDLIISSWNKNSLINKTEYLNLLVSILKMKEFKGIGYDSPDITSVQSKTINHLLFEDFRLPTVRLEISNKCRLPQLQTSLYLNLYTALAQFLLLVGL